MRTSFLKIKAVRTAATPTAYSVSANATITVPLPIERIIGPGPHAGIVAIKSTLKPIPNVLK
jgi:hypothetical protein